MNILNKLSLKNLKMNKKRTISTIIGIALSVALICAVATMCISVQESLVQDTIEKGGYYHLNINGVTDNEIQSLKNNRDIKDIYKISEVGYGKLQEITNKDKPYLKIYSMDEENFNNLKFKLIEGRFPTNENEIIISEHLKENGEVKKNVGDKIKITVGERKTLDGYKLHDSNPYNSNDETITNGKEYEFTIVGVIKRPNYDFENTSYPGYSTITTNLDKSNNNNIYISLKNPKDYKESITQILGAKNYEEVEKNIGHFKFENYQENSELLKWETFAFSSTTFNMISAVAMVVIFIIMFTSIFCIRNSFAISTTEKIKMYGMLASVGTTKKQIRKNVIFEALILALIGIPLGIICGVLAVFILLKIVNLLIGDIVFGYAKGFYFKTSILAIIVSAILGIITIYLSAISSARKASKISPIESLRSTNEIKIKSKKIKSPKIIKKIFGMGGVIAYKNLKRSKKKYRTTVISLAVSIAIFITMSAFLKNMFNASEVAYKEYEHNIEIYPKGDRISKEQMDEILKLDNIEDSYIIYRMKQNISAIELTNTSKFVEKQEKVYLNPEDLTQETVRDVKAKYMEIIAYDSKTFEKYAEKIGINTKKIKNKAILYDTMVEYDTNGKRTEQRVYNYKSGDTIEGKLSSSGDNVKIEIAQVTKVAPWGYENSYSNGGYLFVNIDDFKEYEWEINEILINSSNPNQLEKDLKNEFKSLICENMERVVQEEKSMNMVISIFLYGFITVITLIGVTNIFNTITSNIELRQKEFATLKSIGMTKKEFNKMINLETMFYSVKSLIYGIVLGLLGTFALYKAFSVKFESGIYIPIKPIIISIIAVFILVFIIMKYSINKVNKQNTIETIRKENI